MVVLFATLVRDIVAVPYEIFENLAEGEWYLSSFVFFEKHYPKI